MQKWIIKGTDEVVEAELLTAGNVEQLSHWCNGMQVIERDALEPDTHFVGINVPTSNGRKRASEGDYIVLNNRDGFHVEKFGSFHDKHEMP